MSHENQPPIGTGSNDPRFPDSLIPFRGHSENENDHREKATTAQHPFASKETFVEISPIHMLPTEILRTIFLLCLKTEIISVILPRGPEHTMPWVIIQVCSQWRSVVFGMEEMWVNIEIRVPPPEKTSTVVEENICSLFRAVLSRHTSPISLSVRPQSFRFGAELATKFSNRPQHPDIQGINYEAFGLLFELPAESFPHLESLKLDFNDAEGLFSQLNLPTSSIQSAPNLRTVKYTSSSRSNTCPIGILLLPWPQLTTLTLANLPIPISVMHEVLSHATSITHCGIGVYDPTIISPPPPKYTLPNLSSLSISVIPSRDFGWERLVEPMILPSLRSFVVNFVNKLPQNLAWPEALMTLINQSQCVLENLSVNTPDSPRSDLNRDFLPLAHALPAIRCFNVMELFSAGFFQNLLHTDLFSKLISSSWIVTPDSLISLVGWLLSVSAPRSCGQRLKVSAHCLLRPGYKMVWRALLNQRHSYEKMGIDITLYGFNMGKISSLDVLEGFFDPYVDTGIFNDYERYTERLRKVDNTIFRLLTRG